MGKCEPDPDVFRRGRSLFRWNEESFDFSLFSSHIYCGVLRFP
jgi:hypothetical protein